MLTLVQAPIVRPARPSRPLMASCAVAAIAVAALYAPKAHAQGFDTGGSAPTVVGGSATITPDNSLVTVNNSRTTINWNNAATNFLPNGNGVTFTGGSDYIVLNRILPTAQGAQVQLNGSVSSNIGGQVPGGQVWFYSAGGIMVGANASFNVGSLLLTANDPGTLLEIGYGGGNAFSFASAPGSTAAVEISAGASLNARGRNSYLALIAPRVRQSGNVTVDGSALYVAAEAVDVTINGTLFDISFETGSGVNGTGTGTAALVHDGTTTLDTGYGYTAGPRMGILAAVPKNDAVTMLVQGSFNYTVASGATAVGNKIILSGGYDIVQAGSPLTNVIGDRAPGTGVADIRIRNASFTPQVEGQATRAATAIADTGNLNFSGSLSLTAATEARLDVGAGRTAIVDDFVVLDASALDASAGQAGISVGTGGTLQVRNSINLLANSNASDTVVSGVAPNIVNTGLAQLAIDGGTVEAAQLQIRADAYGRSGRDSGGDATAGTARITIGNGGTLVIDQDAQVTAFGAGGLSINESGYGASIGSGGDGIGGLAEITATSGTLDFGGLQMYAGGNGGSGLNGGTGRGGIARFTATGSAQAEVANSLFIEAEGTRGNADLSGPDGVGTQGDGIGGDIILDFSQRFDADNITLLAAGVGGGYFRDSNDVGGVGQGGTITATFAGGLAIDEENGYGSLNVDASGYGGHGDDTSAPTGRNGSDGFGGDILISIGGPFSYLGDVEIRANGYGGEGGFALNAGSGGNAEGGTISLSLLDGSIAATSLFLSASAEGGEGTFSSTEDGTGTGGSGGNAVGGSASLLIGSTTTFPDVQIDGLSIDAYGDGGFGGFGDLSAGDGGTARGGTARLSITSGNLTTNSFSGIFLNAFGNGGGTGGADTIEDGGRGGIAAGGQAIFEAFGGGTVETFSISLDANAGGGNGDLAGGDATGGGAVFRVGQSTSVDANLVSIYTGAEGGIGLIGGNAAGGSSAYNPLGGILVEVDGSVEVDDSFRMDAEGHGGFSYSRSDEVAETGGSGTGGSIEIDVNGEILTGLGGEGGSMFASVAGFGGISFEGGYGESIGGIIAFTLGFDGRISVTDQLLLYADGGSDLSCFLSGFCDQSRSFVIGGHATGGTINATVFGSILDSDGEATPSFVLYARGLGGAGGTISAGRTGGNGGDGIGGNVTLVLGGDAETTARPLVTVDVSGSGGNAIGFDIFGGEGCCQGDFQFSRFGDSSDLQQLRATPFTGAGGDGIGGTAVISASGDTVFLESIGVNARGTGGEGAFGVQDYTDGPAMADGGDGGAGIGGSITLLAEDGGELRLQSSDLDADGIGGEAGYGANASETDRQARAGHGGRGGDGLGGSIILATNNGTVFAGEGLFFSATGAAGGGGDGGYNDAFDTIEVRDTQGNVISTYQGGNFRGGDGGEGGQGFGGTIAFDIVGGTITAPSFSENSNLPPSVELIANGFGGEGGAPGGNRSLDVGSSFGSGGAGTGGAIRISVADLITDQLEFVAGRGEFGEVSLQSSGVSGEFAFGGSSGLSFAGSVLIDQRASGEDGGGLIMESLYVVVDGQEIDFDTPEFRLYSEIEPVRVLDTVNITLRSSEFEFNSGDAVFQAFGDGGLLADDNVSVRAGRITISQSQLEPDDVVTIAGFNVWLEAFDIFGLFGGVSAVNDIGIQAASASIGTAIAGDDFLARVNCCFTGTDIRATGDGDDLSDLFDEALGFASAGGSNIHITAGDEFSTGSVRLDNGNAANLVELISEGGPVFSDGLITADTLVVDAGTDIALFDLDIRSTIDLRTANGSISGNDFTADGDVLVDASGQVTIASIDAAEDISLKGNGINLNGGTLVAGGSATFIGAVLVNATSDVGAGTDVTFNATIDGNSESGDDGLSVFTNGGNISFAGAVGGTNSLAFLNANANGNISAGAITADSTVSLFGNGPVTATGRIMAGTDFAAFGSTVTLADVTAGADLLIGADGDIVVGNADAGDDIEAFSFDGDLTFASATTNGLSESGYGFDDNFGSNILLGAEGGSIDVGLLDAFDDILADAAGTITFGDATAGRDLLMLAGGNITVGSALAGDDIEANSSGAITFGSGTTTGLGADFTVIDESGYGESGYGESGYGAGPGDGSNIRLIGSGAVRLDDGSAIDLIELRSDTASVFSDGLITADQLSISVAQNIDVNDLLIDSTIDLEAINGFISIGVAQAAGDFLADAGTSFTATTIITTDPDDGEGQQQETALPGIRGLAIDPDGNGVSIATGGPISIGTVDSAGGVSLVSTGGTVQVTTDLIAGGPIDASGTAVSLTAIGTLAVRSATGSAGNVTLTAGGDLTVQQSSASGTNSASSGGLLSLGGAITGSQINLASRDIAIGPQAQVGTAAGTQLIGITANGGASAVTLGGTGTSPGYRLDNAEFGRLAARDVNISVGASETGLRIETLTVRGAGAASPNVTRNLTIFGNEPVRVVGAVAVQNATAQNRLSIGSGGLLFVDRAGGGIAMTSSGTNVAGTLELRGRSVLVSSAAAATDVQNATSVAARDARLAQNDGSMVADGIIRADGIRLAATDRIHVQNTGGTGTPDDRAGLFAGAGGITLVDNNSNGPVEVIINGRQTSGGTTFTGGALIGQLDLEAGYGSFAAATGSTVNGCPFDGSLCGVIVEPEPFIPSGEITTEISNLIDEIEEGDTRPPEIVFSDLVRIERTILSPIIDEPVTGSGNDEYYSGVFFLPDEDEDEEEEGVGQTVTGSGNETLVNTPSGSTENPPTVNDQQVTGTGNDTTLQDPDDR